jgi:hypothetical protein
MSTRVKQEFNGAETDHMHDSEGPKGVPENVMCEWEDNQGSIRVAGIAPLGHTWQQDTAPCTSHHQLAHTSHKRSDLIGLGQHTLDMFVTPSSS